jgi:hypothetical protein
MLLPWPTTVTQKETSSRDTIGGGIRKANTLPSKLYPSLATSDFQLLLTLTPASYRSTCPNR